MTIKKASLSDALEFEYDGDELKTLNSFNWKGQLEVYVKIGETWIFEHDGKALVLSGYYQLSPGVLQFWMLFNKDAKDHAKFIIREFRKMLDRELHKQGVHRVQTLIYKGIKRDAKFAEAFGFEKESTLKSFGPNKEDFIMYRVIR